MHVKNRIKHKIASESCMNDSLSSPFSPVMANVAAGSSSGELVPLTLEKRDSLERKLLRELTEKISCLQETLLNQCIGKENQVQLQNDKEFEILRKDFKKQMKENKSLTLKLCQKKKKNYKN